METTLRNTLRLAITSCRRLLEEDYLLQLEGRYGIRADGSMEPLDAAALLQVKPDLNDGVLLNIAPLRELVPWKEPTRIWEELLHGKYAWSNIATQLRQKGLVKSA